MRQSNRVRLWAVLVWLAVWQAAGMYLACRYPQGHLLLATPVEAAARLGELACTVGFWQTVGTSALRIFGGFAAACLLAVPAAACAARWRRVRELLSPAVSAVKAVPVVSFIILALVWLEGEELSFFIAALMVFPPVYLNLLAGISAADQKLLEMARVFRVPWRRRMWGIYLPQLLPYFRSAVSLALGLCWKAGAAAEVIGLPAGTIGERLYTAKVYYETADLFAWTVVIVAVSMAFEKLFLLAVDHLAREVGV